MHKPKPCKDDIHKRTYGWVAEDCFGAWMCVGCCDCGWSGTKLVKPRWGASTPFKTKKAVVAAAQEANG